MNGACLVDIAHVSGMKPPVFIDSFLGGFLILVITEHDTIGLGEDLADSLRTCAFSIDGNCNTIHRAADRAMDIAYFGRNRDNRRCLSKTITHKELETEVSKCIDIFLVDTGTTDNDHTEITAELIEDILEDIASDIKAALS